MDEKIEKFKKIVNMSNNIVFFGGAGVSTESGIPDFRSKDGLYNQRYKFPPEEILSHHFFYENTEEFFKFYRDKMNSLKFKPNVTHLKLAELEKQETKELIEKYKKQRYKVGIFVTGKENYPEVLNKIVTKQVELSDNVC